MIELADIVDVNDSDRPIMSGELEIFELIPTLIDRFSVDPVDILEEFVVEIVQVLDNEVVIPTLNTAGMLEVEDILVLNTSITPILNSDVVLL